MNENEIENMFNNYDIDKIKSFILTGEIKEYNNMLNISKFLTKILCETWFHNNDDHDLKFIDNIHHIYYLITRLNEFDNKIANIFFNELLFNETFIRNQKIHRDEELNILSEIIRECYLLNNNTIRKMIRLRLGDCISNVVSNFSEMDIGISFDDLNISQEPMKSSILRVVNENENISSDIEEKNMNMKNNNPRDSILTIRVPLIVIASIIEGMKTPLSIANITFYKKVILPLHGLPGKVTYLTPLLGLIHEYLCLCISKFLEKDVIALAPITLQSIIECWPKPWAGNTPKEILLLHELELIIELTVKVFTTTEFSNFRLQIFEKLYSCINSDHSAVCERALKVWANPAIQKIFSVALIRKELVPKIINLLIKSVNTHWNSTVRKMSRNVIEFYCNISIDDFVKMGVNEKVFIDKSKGIQQIKDILNKTLESSEGKNIYGIMDEIPKSMSDITIRDMVREKDLGKGSFGTVYRALRIIKGKPKSEWPKYAIKAIPLQFKAIALREINMMQLISNEYCVKLESFYDCSTEIHLVLELSNYGDLHDMLIKYGGTGLDINIVKSITSQVCSGLEFIHFKEFVFGDLKPENILIFDDGRCKLGDFGAARSVKDECGPGAPMEGTLIYLAPEVISGSTPSYAMDWWAFGCLLYQLSCGRQPVKGFDNYDIDKVANGIVRFNVEDFPLSFPKDDLLKDLIKKLMEKNVNNRLSTSKDVQIHKFWKNEFSTILKNSDKIILEFAKKTQEIELPKGNQNEAWAQRSFSMLHSPLPVKYDFSSKSTTNIKSTKNNNWLKLIVEETIEEENNSWIISNNIPLEPLISTIKSSPIISKPIIHNDINSQIKPKLPVIIKGNVGSNNLTTKMPTSLPLGNKSKYMIKGLDLTSG